MQALNLPPYPFKILQADGKLKIFDPVRRKYLVLTPEEWVRQHFIQYLVNSKGFPKGLLKMEVGHHFSQRRGRYDALFLSREGKPLILVECKAPTVALSRETFEQIARYNSSLEVPYLAITNGLDHRYVHVDLQEKAIKFLDDIPNYEYLDT